VVKKGQQTKHSSIKAGSVSSVQLNMDMKGYTMARGTIAKSIPTYVSEIKAFRDYCKMFEIEPFQITVNEFIRFLTIFRNGDSAQKYATAVKWMFSFCRREAKNLFSHPSVFQVIKGSRKLTEASGIKKKFIYLTPEQVSRMALSATESKDLGAAASFVLAFHFMSRVKDELIPIVFYEGIEWEKKNTEKNYIQLQADPPTIQLYLASRKNNPKGSKLKRGCVCKKNKFNIMCPVHIILKYVRETKITTSGRVFPFSYDSFTRKMKFFASVTQVEKYEALSSKAFRRGAAIWMIQQRNPLANVLEAGGWRSSAFLHYILKDEVDELILFTELAEHSDDEGDKKKNKTTKVAVRRTVKRTVETVAGIQPMTKFFPIRREQ